MYESNIKIILDGEKRRHKITKFSGGELHPNIAHFPARCHDIRLVCRLSSSDDVMEMLLLHEALSARYPKANKNVFIPYMPYARQDRRCAEGDAFSLPLFAKTILRGMLDGYTKFSTLDMHSSAGEGILKTFLGVDVTCYDSTSIIAFNTGLLDYINHGFLIAPDKGAEGKVKSLARSLLHPEDRVAFGKKLRDPETGNLSGFDVDRGDFGGKDVVIVDDICDGGGTFIGLANALRERNCGKISLYVTHGIFSKGLFPFIGVFDTIWTTNSIPQKSEYTKLSGNLKFRVITL